MTLGNEKYNQSQGRTGMQWMTAILANTTLFSYGLQCGWVSAMTKTLQSDHSPTGSPLSDGDISWLASSPSLAAVCSVTVYTILVDKFGRKPCIITIAAFQAICWIIKLFSVTTLSLAIARLSSGVAGGGCFSIIPMYVKEISQDNIRGKLGIILIMAQNFGILAMYSMGGYMEYNTVLWVVMVIPVLNAFAMLKAPESPSFLVKVGKADDAASTIAFLRGLNVNDKVVQHQIDSIKSEDDIFKSFPDVSFAGIFKKPAWRKGFIFLLMLMTAHGLNGGFTIINYASTILAKMGVTISPELQSLSIPVCMIIGSLISMACIERLGRKAILATSFGTAVVSFSGLSAILFVQELGAYVPKCIPILLTAMPVCSYAAGVSPIPFVLMSEMFNFQIRAKIIGCLVTSGWLWAFVQLLSYTPITNTYGAYVSFLCFAVINLYGLLVILILIPETKGKSVEQIELELEKKLYR